MPHRVLVVDDDPDIRETLIEVLEENGHAAFGAVNGSDALQQLRAQDEPPCLIILDLMMPVMDGTTFREQMLRDPALSPIPVIVITAFKDAADRVEDLQVAAHFIKPVSLAELISTVDTYC